MKGWAQWRLQCSFKLPAGISIHTLRIWLAQSGMGNQHIGHISDTTPTPSKYASSLLSGKANNPMTIPLCSRTGDILEPRIKPQWYCDCNEMAARAVAAVDAGELRLIPDNHVAGMCLALPVCTFLRLWLSACLWLSGNVQTCRAMQYHAALCFCFFPVTLHLP